VAVSALDWVFLGRAALAAALGFIIGWERASSGHSAGDRTYALIALGAAAFTTLSEQAFPANPHSLVAGLVTGIGFLGAGVILRPSSGEIKGLTTAASMWAVGALGAVVGTGRYLLALGLTALILLILMWERLPLLSRLGHRKKGPPGPRDDE
jgi:putative Mg2+ transporter-C (MgtC) family protein